MRQTQDAAGEPDVVMEQFPELWIEVKRGAQTRPFLALEQAEDITKNKEDVEAIAVCRNDREDFTVTMRGVTMQRLMKETLQGPLIEAKVCITWTSFLQLLARYRGPSA